MIRSALRPVLVASISLAALFMAAATAATLSVGSKAPPLRITEWIKGEPVKSFEPGKVYVVEFWATWCGPCIRSIPHLTELQRKNPESLVVIGVAAFERPAGPGADGRRDRLKAWVDGRGATMDYRVAYDGDGAMPMTWTHAAGQRSIPSAFVVDHTGTIVYIGPPTGMDGAITSALAKAKKATPPAPGAGAPRSAAPGAGAPASPPADSPNAAPKGAGGGGTASPPARGGA